MDDENLLTHRKKSFSDGCKCVLKDKRFNFYPIVLHLLGNYINLYYI